MHICFLTNEYPKKDFPHGGIGSFVKTIAQELVKKGIKVSVLGFNYSDNYEETIDCGVSIFRLKQAKIKGLSWHFNFRKINAKLEEINNSDKIDIVEASELGLAFIKKKSSTKYVIRLHGGHHFFAESENRKINWWKGFQEKRSFKKADGFIAVSKFVKSHTEKYLSYNNKPIEFINYPINSDLFMPTEGKIILNKIVFAGTVCEKKGVRQLIQAFSIIIKQFPAATLDIYGRDWFYADGSSYIEMLKNKEIKDSKSITFKGSVKYEEIPKKYAQAEVCVFPSHMETQGLVAPEAMAMEKMVVFSQQGPGSETIIDYETGLLCNPHDPEDIAEKIIWVFNNLEKSNEIAKNARISVLNKFDIEKITQKNIDFYKTIID